MKSLSWAGLQPFHLPGRQLSALCLHMPVCEVWAVQSPQGTDQYRCWQVPIRVLYLDRSMDSGADAAAVNHHDFVPEEVPEGSRCAGHAAIGPV